jgi:hypothetical protein
MKNEGVPKRVFAAIAKLAMEAREIADAALQLQKEVESERIREAKETVEQQ